MIKSLLEYEFHLKMHVIPLTELIGTDRISASVKLLVLSFKFKTRNKTLSD